MSNPNKQKGTSLEVAWRDYLRKEGFEAERLAMSGKLDEGDVWASIAADPFIFECKNVAKLNIGGWVKEAEVEAHNYAKARALELPPYFAVVHKRRNHPIMNAFVTTPAWQFLEIVRTPF